MDGTYSADGAPGTVAAFDDRELDVAADGSSSGASALSSGCARAPR